MNEANWLRSGNKPYQSSIAKSEIPNDDDESPYGRRRTGFDHHGNAGLIP
jgi:hypothetical protein